MFLHHSLSRCLGKISRKIGTKIKKNRGTRRKPPPRVFLRARARARVYFSGVCRGCSGLERGSLCSWAFTTAHVFSVSRAQQPARTYARTQPSEWSRERHWDYTYVHTVTSCVALTRTKGAPCESRARICCHSSDPLPLLSPFSLPFDITRTHCLHTRNFPLFHVFSPPPFSLLLPVFPSSSSLPSPPQIISAPLSLLATHSSRGPRFFSLRLNVPPRRPPFPRPSFRPSSCSLYTRPSSSVRVEAFRLDSFSSVPPRPDPTKPRACTREDPKRSQRARGCWPRARCTFCPERDPRATGLPPSPLLLRIA